jgi:hypothetical protein
MPAAKIWTEFAEGDKMITKTFTSETEADARREAEEWWRGQIGFRQIERTIVGTGDEGPSRSQMDRWTVTIHYEPEISN